jgi:hypothetical protein
VLGSDRSIGRREEQWAEDCGRGGPVAHYLAEALEHFTPAQVFEDDAEAAEVELWLRTMLKAHGGEVAHGLCTSGIRKHGARRGLVLLEASGRGLRREVHTTRSEARWMAALIADVRAHRKVAIACMSRAFALRLRRRLRREVRSLRDAGAIAIEIGDNEAAEAARAEAEDDEGWEQRWRDARVILFSPKFEAGMSYEDADVFRVYGQMTTGAGTPSQFMQLLHRVRRIEGDGAGDDGGAPPVVPVLIRGLPFENLADEPSVAEVENCLATPRWCAEHRVLPAHDVGVPVRWYGGSPTYPLRDALFHTHVWNAWERVPPSPLEPPRPQCSTLHATRVPRPSPRSSLHAKGKSGACSPDCERRLLGAFFDNTAVRAALALGGFACCPAVPHRLVLPPTIWPIAFCFPESSCL